MYGTRKKFLNTEIEPHIEALNEINVVGGTWTRKDCSTRPSNVHVYRFRHYDIILFIFNFQIAWQNRYVSYIRLVSLSFELAFLYKNLTFSQLFTEFLPIRHNSNCQTRHINTSIKNFLLQMLYFYWHENISARQ